MSKKTKEPKDFLFEHNIIIDEYDTGRFKNRHIRLIEDSYLQIGESDKTFDRWANSVEFTFEIWQDKGQRQFLKWLKEELI